MLLVYFVIVALTSMSDMLGGLFSHMSGVLRLLKILLVSGSTCEYCVILRIFLSSCFIPMVLGVRVILNTTGILDACCRVPFCAALVIACCRRFALVLGWKYCCMSLVLCALSQS